MQKLGRRLPSGNVKCYITLGISASYVDISNCAGVSVLNTDRPPKFNGTIRAIGGILYFLEAACRAIFARAADIYIISIRFHMISMIWAICTINFDRAAALTGINCSIIGVYG